MTHIILAATPGSGSGVVVDKLLKKGFTRIDVVTVNAAALSNGVIIDGVDDYLLLTEDMESVQLEFPPLAGSATHSSLDRGQSSKKSKAAKSASAWKEPPCVPAPPPDRERISAEEMASNSPPKHNPISFQSGDEVNHNTLLRNEAGPVGHNSVSVSLEELDNLLVRNWERNYVIVGLHRWDHIEKLLKRPQSLLVAVDAPFSHRVTNFKHAAFHVCMSIDADMCYVWKNKQNVGLAITLKNASYSIDVLSRNAQPLDEQLWFLKNLSPGNRPSRDESNMHLARVASLRSNCMKRRVGAVVVKHNRIVSMGYNGTPAGQTNCNEGGCFRCNSGAPSGTNLEMCFCLHAEANALSFAGMKNAVGATLYCTLSPCMLCAIMICQYKISTVVYEETYTNVEMMIEYLKNSGIAVVKHKK